MKAQPGLRWAGEQLHSDLLSVFHLPASNGPLHAVVSRAHSAALSSAFAFDAERDVKCEVWFGTVLPFPFSISNSRIPDYIRISKLRSSTDERPSEPPRGERIRSGWVCPCILPTSRPLCTSLQGQPHRLVPGNQSSNSRTRLRSSHRDPTAALVSP